MPTMTLDRRTPAKTHDAASDTTTTTTTATTGIATATRSDGVAAGRDACLTTSAAPGRESAADGDPACRRPRHHHGILVTGSHRSGTTWVGQMIAAAPRTCYLHEPFKPRWDPPENWTQFRDWFTYVTDQNAAQYERGVARTLGLHFDWRRCYRNAPSVAQAINAAKRWFKWTSRRVRAFRPIMKDPIALFSAPWLAERFNLGVVIMIRHPAAFASSIKLKKWHFPFENWLRQPELMADLLQPFEVELRDRAAHNDDLIEQAILQWRVFHHVIHQFQIAHPGWQFIRHEDLSRDPVTGFRRLYDKLELTFTPQVEQAIRESSNEGNVKDAAVAGLSTHWVKVNSAENVKNWQRRLTAEEIHRVRAGTADVAHYYYGDDDWE